MPEQNGNLKKLSDEVLLKKAKRSWLKTASMVSELISRPSLEHRWTWAGEVAGACSAIIGALEKDLEQSKSK